MRACLPLLLFLAIALPAFNLTAAEPAIGDLTATVRDDAVTVSFRLEHAFDREEIIQALRSGLPTVFVFEIDLIRRRRNWFDSMVASSRIEVVATYNSLTREYLLNYRRNRKLVSSETVRDFDQLRERMTQIREERLFPLEGRNPGRMRIRTRAILDREYLFYIVPRPVATEWEVTRLRNPSPVRS
jgi:hypothetical protein